MTTKQQLSLFFYFSLCVQSQCFTMDLEQARSAAGSIIGAGMILGSGALVYAYVDSNETLLRKADEYIAVVDSCQDMLPPALWNDTSEAYYTWYIKNKFSLNLSDVTVESSQLLHQYVEINKEKVALARQCCQFRSGYFKSMKDKLQEIERLQALLEQASLNISLYYDAFFVSQYVSQQMNKLQSIFDNINTFENMLPPSSWNEGLEAYLVYYLDARFSIKLSEVNKESFDTIQKYIEKNKTNCVVARQIIYNLRYYQKDMGVIENQIKTIELQLSQATINLKKYYNNFLLAHIIINFYKALPVYDKNSYEFDVANKLMGWIRRGSFAQCRYPLLSCKDRFSCDMYTVEELLSSSCDLLNECPEVYNKLTNCCNAMEYFYDLLIRSAHYQQEKDDKHKDDILRKEEEKVQEARRVAIAAQQAVEAQLRQARAQEEAAEFQRRQALAASQSADAQNRQARAQEEANRIEKEKQKKEKK